MGTTPAPPDPCGPAELLALTERIAAQLEQAAAGTVTRTGAPLSPSGVRNLLQRLQLSQAEA